jgi:hypothetical protein
MTPNFQREFQLMSARAKRQLKEVAASGSYRHVFSLWITPSFSPSTRCTVYSPSSRAKGKRAFAEFAIWRSNLDLEKLRSPVERLKHPRELAPTMQAGAVWLGDAEVEDIERRVRGVSIPVFPEKRAVARVDGTSFELCLDEPSFAATLRWWDGYPPEWAPLTGPIMRICRELEDRREHRRSPA